MNINILFDISLTFIRHVVDTAFWDMTLFLQVSFRSRCPIAIPPLLVSEMLCESIWESLPNRVITLLLVQRDIPSGLSITQVHIRCIAAPSQALPPSPCSYSYPLNQEEKRVANLPGSHRAHVYWLASRELGPPWAEGHPPCQTETQTSGPWQGNNKI